jgi:hypothetical protein
MPDSVWWTPLYGDYLSLRDTETNLILTIAALLPDRSTEETLTKSKESLSAVRK